MGSPAATVAPARQPAPGVAPEGRSAQGPHYKWIVLSNTTLGTLLATVNASIADAVCGYASTGRVTSLMC